MARHRPQPLAALLAAALLALLASPAVLAGPRILHEYVPPPGERRDEGKLDPTAPPDWIRTDDQVLPRPGGPAKPGKEERVLESGVSGIRPRSLTMDRTTTHDGVLNYTAEFNPSVVPHKRMAAFDRVGPGYALGISSRALTPLELTPRSSPPGRDPFWASLVLKVRRGAATPIPSVAPGVRVLSYRTTPTVKLTFHLDSADNMWVKAERTARIRLVLLSDAPRAYFSPRIPAKVTASLVPAARRPRLPAAVKRSARKVLRRLRVRQGAPMKQQLDRLVAYFRSFRAGKLPAKGTGDTYLDIALGQRGVCRHRAFAFMITAQALGIPTRYVQNEAHAFSEVFVPRLGWARVDLGGASSELRVHNGRKRAVHRPGPDPFPVPSSYGARQGQGQGQGQGQSNSAIPQADRITGLDRTQRSRLRARTRGRYLRGQQGEAPEGKPGEAAPRRLDLNRGAPEAPAAPPRLATLVKLATPKELTVVFRGAPLSVAGAVTHAGRGVPGLQVDLLISRDGRVGYPVGSLVTDSRGRFSGELLVPQDVEVGKYRVFAETPGDSKHEGSRSR